MGRRRLPIDPEQVRKLAQLGCSLREIGTILGCDHKTISNRFSAIVELGDTRGKIALRRWQMRRAKAGSDKMLIHLGMSRLDQKIKTDLTSDGKPVTTYVERANNPRDIATTDDQPPAEAVGAD